MVQDTIKCPKCGEMIKLSQAISKDIEIELKNKYEKQAEEKINSELKKLKAKEETLIKEYESKEEQFNAHFLKERKQIEEKIRKDMTQAQHVELKDLKERLIEKEDKLKKAEQQELDLRKKQRDLEEKTRSMEIDIARRIDQERQAIINKISKEVEESHRLKDAEKEKQLTDMRKQIEDLKRKAEQGSQQCQGEVLELELEQILKSNFPYDIIEPVPKGIRGADVLQKVHNSAGQCCGTIIWESKRTKGWSDGWIDKLKDDQRKMKAEIAVLMSIALPKEINNFTQFKGIWITSYSLAAALAFALRTNLIELAGAKQAAVGKVEKMEAIYSYLSGAEFKQKVEAIAEAFLTMKADLMKEKIAMERLWTKREKQIERVVTNTVRMYGDMQAIIGASLPQIKSLELKALTDETGTVDASE